MIRVVLSDPACEAMARATLAAGSEEACGLLLGQREGDLISVARVVATANVALDPTRRFEIDPAAQFAVLRAAREAGDAVVGHFHSHPVGPPAPSETDQAMACDLRALWVIAAPAAGQPEGTARGVLLAAYHPDAAGRLSPCVPAEGEAPADDSGLLCTFMVD